MGQQQLLLLVLGIVIVGLAVVAGIQAFGENNKKSNADAMVNDAVRIANDAQAWAMKPTAFGGGNGSLDDVSFADLGYRLGGNNCASTEYGTVNGCYELAETEGGIDIIAKNTQHEHQVTISVVGLNYDDITTGTLTDITPD